MTAAMWITRIFMNGPQSRYGVMGRGVVARPIQWEDFGTETHWVAPDGLLIL